MSRPNTIHPTRRMNTLATAVTATLCLAPLGSPADDNGRRALHIPSQSLQTAINQLSEQADWQISYPAELVKGLTAPSVSGQYSAREALDRLLSGSGLIAVKTPNGAVTVVKAEARPEAEAGKAEAALLAPMTVTGSAEYDAADPYNPDYNRPNATTATKTDTPIMETPVSIQVIPKAILADKQITTLPDAVNGQVSGVLGRTGGGYLYDNFIIRGLAGSGFGDAYRNGLFNRQDIYDIANIERIDILKGPAAVLYGRIEPGGLVNYVTKKPLDTAYYSIQQQFGSYDQYRTLMDATGPIDQNKTLLYRINGSYTNNQSFRDFVGNERFFVAPVVTWRPTDRIETHLELEYKHDRFNADFGIPAINGRPAPIPITRTLKDGPDRQSVESTLVGFDWTYRLNEDWKITQRYLFKDWTLSGPTLFNFGGLDADNRTLNRTAYKSVQDVMTHSGNLDLNGKFDLLGSRHNLLIGFDGFLASTESPSASEAAPSIDIFNPVYGQVDFDALTTDNGFFYRKESWLGAYVQDQITFFDRLHLLLGGRYDNVTTGANFYPMSLAAARAGRVAQKRRCVQPAPRPALPGAGLAVPVRQLHQVVQRQQRRQRGRREIRSAARQTIRDRDQGRDAR